MATVASQTMDPATPHSSNRLSLGLLIEASILVNVASYFFAFFLRGRFAIPSEVMVWIWSTLPAVLGLKTAVLLLAFTKADAAAKFNFSANHICFVAATLGALGIFVLNFTVFPTYFYPIPRSVIVIDWALSLFFWTRLRSIGMRFVYGSSVCQDEVLMSPQNEIPTISMGSGGPKVSC